MILVWNPLTWALRCTEWISNQKILPAHSASTLSKYLCLTAYSSLITLWFRTLLLRFKQWCPFLQNLRPPFSWPNIIFPLFLSIKSSFWMLISVHSIFKSVLQDFQSTWEFFKISLQQPRLFFCALSIGYTSTRKPSFPVRLLFTAVL